MTYKKKLTLCLLLVTVLAFVFTLTVVRDFRERRGNFFAWLDPSLSVLADRIEIRGLQGGTLLVRENNIWYFRAGEIDLPVKQGRVEDLFAVLTRKDTYTPRAVSGEARNKLGLSEETASYIVIRGGAGLPLLELFAGKGGALGNEIYLRRAGGNEIYSGEDRFTYYIDARPAAWYDLRLFPESLNAAMIQQVDITLPGPGEPYILRRSGGGWTFADNRGGPEPDPLKVEAWLRTLLGAEAEDFVPDAPAGIPPEGVIVLMLGDGTEKTLFIGPGDDDFRNVFLAGSDLPRRLSGWTAERLFRERAYFPGE